MMSNITYRLLMQYSFVYIVYCLFFRTAISFIIYLWPGYIIVYDFPGQESEAESAPPPRTSHCTCRPEYSEVSWMLYSACILYVSNRRALYPDVPLHTIERSIEIH